MHGVCLQTKLSFPFLNFFIFTKNFVRISSNSFDGYLEYAFKLFIDDYSCQTW